MAQDELLADIESLKRKKTNLSQDLKELKLRGQTLESKPTDVAITEMELGLLAVEELSIQSKLQQSVINGLVVSEQLLLEIVKRDQ